MSNFQTAPLFSTTVAHEKSAASNRLPPFLFRERATDEAIGEEMLDILQNASCGLISHPSTSDSGLSSSTLRPLLSLCNDESFAIAALEQVRILEWQFFDKRLADAPFEKLSNLAPRMPIDVDNAKRLEQRLSLLRRSTREDALIGIALPIKSVIENAATLNRLPVNFLSLIFPEVLLTENHLAKKWMRCDVIETLRSALNSLAESRKRGLQFAIQAPLESGYDAAVYRAMGIECIVLNSFKGTIANEEPKDQTDSIVSSFLGNSILQPSSDHHRDTQTQNLKTFFSQFQDAQSYEAIER